MSISQKYWQDIRLKLTMLQKDLQRSDILKDAYSMSYVTLLSLVPSLAVTFALISLFTPFLGENSSLVTQAKSFILSHLATGSGEQVISYLDEFIANVDLKKIGFTGFIGTTVSLVLLLQNIEGALNRIFQVEKPRNMLTRFIYFWTLITLGTFIVALSIGALSGFDFTSSLELDGQRSSWIGRLVYISGIFIFFSLLYKMVPNRSVRTKPAAIGGACATVLLLLAIQLFGLYTNLVQTYEAIYGAALSAIPLFLLWMYVVWLVVLLGGSISWRWQQGFLPQDEMIFDQLSSSLRSHNQALLKAKLPLLLMIEIYRCYETSNNKGFDPSEYETKTHIPLSWLESSLDALSEKDLVIQAQSKEEGESRYFPTQSADHLTIEQFYQSLDHQEIEWLHKLVEQRHIPREIFDRKIGLEGGSRTFAESLNLKLSNV